MLRKISAMAGGEDHKRHGAAPEWPAAAQHPREETRMQYSLLCMVVSVLIAFGMGVAHGKDYQGVTVPGRCKATAVR